MLHFFPPGMLERYLLFAFLAVLGVLQLIAAHYRWVGFSLPGRQRWEWGYALGGGLLGSAYLWFFSRVQHLIFVPGLAGTELFTVFAASTLLALAATLTLVSLLHPSPALERQSGERAHFDPGEGTIQRPANSNQHPATVVVSDLPDGGFPISQLRDRLVRGGCVALSVDLARDGPVEYPEVLARLPAACAYLQDQPGVSHDGVVLIGAGVGGDLALRAASTDASVAGVAVIDPVPNPAATSLDLLRHSTLWEALRWGNLRRRLAEGLTPIEHRPHLRDRQVLLVAQRSGPTLPDEAVTAGAQVAVVDTHAEAIERVAEWVAELAATL
ncbi:MAG: hypothetical protein MAG451_02254 [Anaerolineales bacterium]|nr:hypothetical protein [Anaerolineales bacterium]